MCIPALVPPSALSNLYPPLSHLPITGGEGPAQEVFPRIRERDPYKRIGISREVLFPRALRGHLASCKGPDAPALACLDQPATLCPLFYLTGAAGTESALAALLRRRRRRRSRTRATTSSRRTRRGPVGACGSVSFRSEAAGAVLCSMPTRPRTLSLGRMQSHEKSRESIESAYDQIINEVR